MSEKCLVKTAKIQWKDFFRPLSTSGHRVSGAHALNSQLPSTKILALSSLVTMRGIKSQVAKP
jgi:hypothetical protein